MFASSHTGFRERDRGHVSSPYAQGQLYHRSQSLTFGQPSNLGACDSQAEAPRLRLSASGEASGHVSNRRVSVCTPGRLRGSEEPSRPEMTPQKPLVGLEASKVIKESPGFEARNERSASCDSDIPLEITARARELKSSSSSPSASQGVTLDRSDNGSQLTTALMDATRLNLKQEEDEDMPLFCPRAAKPSGPLIEGNKYQADVDWIDACQRCIKQGLRCFTAAGSLLSRTRCEECVDHHRLCIVDGVNVCSAHDPQPTSKRIVPSSPKLRTPPAETPKQTRRRSGRQIQATQQTPVILTVSSQRQARSQLPRKRIKLRSKLTSTPQPVQSSTIDGSFSDDSSISSVPESDPEDRVVSNPSRSRGEKRSGPEKDKVNVSKKESETSASQNAELSTTAEKYTFPVHCEGQASKQQPKCDPSPMQAAEKRLEEYTKGLIKDISSAIRRCQERVGRMSEQAGLLVLKITVEVLIGDLDKLLANGGQSGGADNPSHWVVCQLAEYLQRLRHECQVAHEAIGSEDEAGRQVKQVAAFLASETLFDRCLTLISMHVGEN